MLTQKLINNLCYQIVGCAIEELLIKHFDVKSQVLLPVKYKGKELGSALRIDILVDDLVIIELKSVEIMIPLYKAQLLAYLKLTNKPKGLLINFNCENITEQLVPLVTEEFAKLPKE